jgi:tetratricopeptide (TPR) repeat protein
MAVRKRWAVIGAVIVVAVGVAYVLITRTKEPDTSEQEAYIAEVQKARDEVPEALTLEEAKKEYEDFVRAHADWQEQTAERIKELQEAYDADPVHSENARELVWYLQQLGRWSDAKEVCERWTKAAPESGMAWHELASCCQELDLDDEAEAAMDEIATLLGHESALLHATRASEAHSRGDMSTAMAEAEKAVEVATTDREKALALRVLAQLHLALNSHFILDDDGRREAWAAAYAAADESLEYEENLYALTAAFSAGSKLLSSPGGARRAREQKEDERLPGPGEPREQLQKALDGWPHCGHVWAVLSQDRRDRKDDCGAWSAAKAAYFLCPKDPCSLGRLAACAERIELEPDATEARQLLASVLEGSAEGGWPEVRTMAVCGIAGAAAHFRPNSRAAAPKLAALVYPHVRDRIPGRSETMFRLSWALRHGGHYDQALEAAQISLQHPGMMQAMGTDMLANAAIAAAAAGQPDRADKYLAQLSAAGPVSGCVYNDMAWQTALFGGDYEWALTVIDRAIQADQGNPSYQDTKAYVLVRAGEFEDARQLCNKLIQAGFGGFAVGYLGLMCEAEGDHEKALEYLRQVELPPGATDDDMPYMFEEARERLEARLAKTGT